VRRLALGLRGTFGCETAIACDTGDMMSALIDDGITVFPTPFNSVKRGLFSQRASLQHAFRTFAPDIVHSHSRWPTIAARCAGRRVDVSTLHGGELTRHGSVLDRWPIRRVLPAWGTCVTVLDPSFATMLERECGIRSSSIHSIPNGTNEQYFTPVNTFDKLAIRRQIGLEPHTFVLSFVGQLANVKRPAWCILALEAMVNIGLSVNLLIVGDGPERHAMEQFAVARGVREHCHFIGWTADPRPHYWASDLLLLPSESEGFGLVVVEAMLCGVPCVRTRSGGCQAQIIDGVTGWSTDHSQDAFVATALKAARDREVLPVVASNARKHAAEHLSESRFLERTFELYQSLLQKRQ
jgi:glycosyltransferase involved in cell wall biosynthesis